MTSSFLARYYTIGHTASQRTHSGVCHRMAKIADLTTRPAPPKRDQVHENPARLKLAAPLGLYLPDSAVNSLYDIMVDRGWMCDIGLIYKCGEIVFHQSAQA